MYHKINGSEYRRIFVVGDIHGCYKKLMDALERVQFERAVDLLVSVGDLADRGPQNIECYELINANWFRAVRGNHEQMAIEVLAGGEADTWMANGGRWFFLLDDSKRSQVEELIKRAGQLPLVLEITTDRGKYVIAHADYPSNEYVYGRPINEHLVVWNRKRLNAAMKGESEEITGADKFIFGHTPLVKPLLFKNQLYIDTGAVFGNTLTLIQIQ
ncbi:metallophosphoesterase [Yersinia mollaretii]|uniref:Diadenosine tetraphosphatase and serine/threonine protein phosphatase n=1 Tax=Yersinia mollaretii (strain ATCC 43969 / DSM 18520 / CIP 103324 / CNY 7263 / WAIP 204) TaxID=349967 RepID=A0ABM9YEJ8_YERMW|nr:metallophosphoesterase [Yersinia mollaretii]EEQ12344.1 Diadenosine tetraphosphatase and serine/threonine protein phosphatase [Yersinia mollaretii ATCC 43969]PJE89644.1 serine/threonine-protein phosphatase [Yersinia mollaretii]QKJ03510.1 metallophosphoesterase [Yersinia mollaretii ATCC 43969]CQD36504.1 serine/threonine protein phosphatase [Yersinia mollaretii]CQH01185.1 serine/threonine protein phosphatase [Yersinia mollaretii]